MIERILSLPRVLIHMVENERERESRESDHKLGRERESIKKGKPLLLQAPSLGLPPLMSERASPIE